MNTNSVGIIILNGIALPRYFVHTCVNILT